MTDARMRPAWSSVFEAGTVPPVEAILPVDDITRDWALGGSTGKGIRVAVIDSGVEAEHPAVKGVAGYVSVEGPAGGVFNEGPHDDAFGHGTACAGIIRSLAPECELYSVRVLGPYLRGRGHVFARGLEWAIENGMQVCNLSLGSTSRELFGPLYEIADAAYFRNVPLVTAANNVPIPTAPSLYASVLSVAAHDLKDPELIYYNPQPPVEFGAAGIDVRVAWKGGTWITATGNSFAAPHVTGLVARILAKHPGLTVFQLKAILRALAANIVRREAPAPP
jgi:subtilisin